MNYLRDNCRLIKLTEKTHCFCSGFSCGNADLDDFFRNDAMKYKRELLGKTYCFVSNTDENEIVAMFTLSNDSIRVDIIPNSRGKRVNKQIPYESQEAENLGYSQDTILNTRLMFFDLKNIAEE